MKKLLLLLPLLFLGACDVSSVENADTAKIDNADSREITVYTDPETKVQYLVFHGDNSGGMIVRLNPDGTPMIAEQRRS